MGRRETKAGFRVRRKRAVDLDVLRLPTDGGRSMDGHAVRLLQDHLHGLNAVVGQQFLERLAAGKRDIEVVFGQAQGARAGSRFFCRLPKPRQALLGFGDLARRRMQHHRRRRGRRTQEEPSGSAENSNEKQNKRCLTFQWGAGFT